MLAAAREELGELEAGLEPIGVGCEHRTLQGLGRQWVACRDQRARAQRLDHRLSGAQLGGAVQNRDRFLGFLRAEIQLSEGNQPLEVVGLAGQQKLERFARFAARRDVAVGEVHRDARLRAQHLCVVRSEPACRPHLAGCLDESATTRQNGGVLEMHPGVVRSEGDRLGVRGQRGLGLSVRQQRTGEKERIGSCRSGGFRANGSGGGEREDEAQQGNGGAQDRHQRIIAGLGLFPPAPV